MHRHWRRLGPAGGWIFVTLADYLGKADRRSIRIAGLQALENTKLLLSAYFEEYERQRRFADADQWQRVDEAAQLETEPLVGDSP
ncbi:MAG: hypothetical protein IPK17_05055 [Chloroflexi bacterium]|uniref:hypothetical protein n=1 Tax=Candidatus Flexifilum breve TaxID=3140694 RepID=UPI003136E6A8|nr:hypothetical protein [Chloroflexota bacterium]